MASDGTTEESTSGASSPSAEDATAKDAVTVGSLCTGYGGLDLGLALALGVPVRHAWHVEIEGVVAKGKRKGELFGPRAILAARFPGVPNYVDLKTLDYAEMERVDWLTAGYPCQPFSNAGLRLGAADARHLWPYVADTIGALRPRNVLLENVRGHVRRGLDSVIADLASLGYGARWGVVRASDAGAPHRRERIFIVATDARGERHGGGQDGGGLGRLDRWLEGEARQRQRARQEPVDRGAEAAQDADSTARGERRESAPGQAPGGRSRPDLGGRGGAPTPDSRGVGRVGWPDLEGARRDPSEWGETGGDARDGGGARPQAAPDADCERREGRAQRDGGQVEPGLEASQWADADGRVLDWSVYEPAIRRWERASGRPAPWATEPRGRGGVERLSPRFVEWMMGLPAGWVTDVPGLTPNEQLKALGNGVVPQQAALAIRVLTAATAAEVAA